MSESKGISLRRKKTTRPTISAPRQLAPARDPSVDSESTRNNSVWDTQSVASGKTNTNLSVPGREGRPSLGGDHTSDLVKRRYSTRFTGGVPQYGNGIAPPAVPSLPAQYAGGRQRSPARSGGSDGDRSRSRSHGGRSPERAGGNLRVDARAFKDPNMQAEGYVQSILAEATEDDILAYQNDLQTLKSHTNVDLQHNVYQNRTQFVKISKEADKLKSEMRTLRTLMSDLTGALGHATSAGGVTAAELGISNSAGSRDSLLSVADRKRANRSSVANLEAMWSSHLQTLWKRVEGSQKYLPALPGRHIILESQRWVELNAATWKPRRRVALVLLNDHLLIASEKKAVQNNASNNKNNRMSMYNGPSGTAGGQSTATLIAERCWPLQDISLADISTHTSTTIGHSHTRENAAIANAVSIRAGTESLTYATNDTAEKASLLVAFRKAQEDMRKQLAVEHGARERQLDEIARLTGRDPRLLKKAAAEQAETDKSNSLTRSNSVLIDVDGRQQSIRWMEAQIDGLDIDIALQRHEEAVARVEKLRKLAQSIKGNATVQSIILTKVNERAHKLATNIARQLSQTSSGVERTKGNVSWLLRLGYEELARTRYLASRTETIRLRTRGLPFTGPLPPYLHALSFTTFTLILHTLRTFSAAFSASAGSAVVRWAKERVEEFNSVLERQMGSVERGSDLWAECLKVVKEQSAVLGEAGVDFAGLVAKGLEGGGEAAVRPGVPRRGSSLKGKKARGGGAVGLGVSV